MRTSKTSGNMADILVTGGAGFIGSHACKALARAGYRPIAFDSLARGHEWAVKWGPLIVGDISDRAALARAFARFKPAAVLHFAALAYVADSVRDPAHYYRTNVSGTLSLLEAMLEHGVSAIVFSSSCATYGIPETIPIAEHHPQRPINPYGASKLMVERMLGDYGSAYGLRSISLRYFNAAGADPDGEVGEDHEPETHLVPLALEAASGRLPCLTVFGDDYDTADGTCVRDYVHVSDLAEAHVLALDKLLRGHPTAAFNLGNGKGFSVGEIIAAARRVTGRHIPVRIGARRAGDPARLVADASRAKRELGWEPRLSDIGSILETAWAWHRTRHSGRSLSHEEAVIAYAAAARRLAAERGAA
jgi:UDP-arabinose 4-epimerase